jgi:hypothetical protein
MSKELHNFPNEPHPFPLQGFAFRGTKGVGIRSHGLALGKLFFYFGGVGEIGENQRTRLFKVEIELLKCLLSTA